MWTAQFGHIAKFPCGYNIISVFALISLQCPQSIGVDEKASHLCCQTVPFNVSCWCLLIIDHVKYKAGHISPWTKHNYSTCAELEPFLLTTSSGEYYFGCCSMNLRSILLCMELQSHYKYYFIFFKG